MASAVAATPSVELRHLLPCPARWTHTGTPSPPAQACSRPPGHTEFLTHTPPSGCPLLACLSQSLPTPHAEHTCTTLSTYTHSPHDTHPPLFSHRPTGSAPSSPAHVPSPSHADPHQPTDVHCFPSSPSLTDSFTNATHTHSPTHILTTFSHACVRAHTHFQSLPHTIAFLPLSLTNTPSAKSVAVRQSSP